MDHLALEGRIRSRSDGRLQGQPLIGLALWREIARCLLQILTPVRYRGARLLRGECRLSRRLSMGVRRRPVALGCACTRSLGDPLCAA